MMIKRVYIAIQCMLLLVLAASCAGTATITTTVTTIPPTPSPIVMTMPAPPTVTETVTIKPPPPVTVTRTTTVTIIPPAPPTPTTFEPIIITGDVDFISMPFLVTTEEWVIEWSVIVEPGASWADIDVYFYPRGETSHWVFWLDANENHTSGWTYFYTTPGEYYIEVDTYYIKSWTITISPGLK